MGAMRSRSDGRTGRSRETRVVGADLSGPLPPDEGWPALRGLRVCLVCQPTTGGAAMCTRQLAEAGVRAGANVVVACPGGGYLSDWAREVGATWKALPLTRGPNPRDLPSLARVASIAAACDVMHLHSSTAGAVGRLALLAIPRKSRPACVFTPHAWSWWVGGPGAVGYRLLERQIAPIADAIVAVSDDAAQIGRRVLGRRSGRIRVIPNGVDVVHFSPDGPAVERDPHRPLIVCVGRLTAVKGFDLAVRAIAELGRPVRLRLVGEGPQEAELRQLAARLGVAADVEFAGYRSDPVEQYRAADVVLVPSRRDAFSLVLLEAMATGNPIIATRVCGASALEGAGVLVDTEDASAIASTLRELLDAPGRRVALAAAARRRALAEYDLRRSLGATLELWMQLGRVAGASRRRS
jgi:glycosyltransferase involved in cell wall biosynthesis